MVAAPLIEVPGTANKNTVTGTTGAASVRIIGIDVARGLAILGMMGVHMLNAGPVPWIVELPDNWDQAFAGRSAVLFGVVAGVSVALMSGRTHPVAGTSRLQARMRIVVRALAIFALGGFLTTLDHNVNVILEYYGVLFVLVLPFLGWQPKQLFQLVALMMVVLPLLYIVIENLVWRSEFGRWTPLTGLLFSGGYPAIIWIVYILLGLGVGRLTLNSTRVQVRLLCAGAAMTFAAYASGKVAEQQFPWLPPTDGSMPGRFDLGRMATIEPHSGTWFEVIGSGGLSLAIIAVSLVAAHRLRFVLYPIAMAGSMALSVYVFHVVSMIWIHPNPETQYQVYFGTVAIMLIATSIWGALLGKGPLERVLAYLSNRATDITSIR
jgi:uncharacterized membrane protein